MWSRVAVGPMSDRLLLLRRALERQHERITALVAQRPDLKPALEPVLQEAGGALAQLHSLARPESSHEAGSDVVGSA